jgi:hypothetical protein
MLIRMAAVVLGMVVVGTASMAAEVEPGVYYCTDAKGAGLAWDKNPQGDGRVVRFDPDRYIMKVISKERRDVTRTVGDSKGRTSPLTCNSPWPGYSTVLSCHEISGFNVWAFNGGRYTRAFISGTPLGYSGADPNIMVYHGTCVKY